MKKKLEWILIFLAHILLLWWMLHLLNETGNLDTLPIAAHITGIALYGALLIRVSAWLGMKRYRKELQENNEGLAKRS